MNTMPALTDMAPATQYDATRFNALRHGVLSRYTVLPWEVEEEYRSLLNALVSEHAPDGPTEEHMVEELAGIIWRKRRLRMAEAALIREKLRYDVTAHNEEHIAAAALLPSTGVARHDADVPRAVAAAAIETARELRGIKRDLQMTQRAWNILEAGSGTDAYKRAIAALRDDTRTYWLECLSQKPSDGLTYAPTAEALKAWIRRHWKEWYDNPIIELEHRDAIRDQALGAAYAAHDLVMPARYEVHLDRKLERTLAMLFRLRELRRPMVPG